MTIEDKIHAFRLHVLRRAQERGNVSAACRELNIRHTRTRPRHAWTNGFVKRLQGTILHEHWRVAFRRRCFRRFRDWTV